MYSVFSTFQPEYLLQQLTEKLGQQNQKFEVSDKTWKVKFNVRKQLNEDAVLDGESAGVEVQAIYEEAVI